MRNFNKFFIIFFYAVTLLYCNAPKKLSAQPKPPEKTEDKASYILGYNIGQQLSAQNMDVTLDFLIQGLSDSVLGKETAIPAEEWNNIMAQFQQEVQAKQNKVGEENLKKADAFLEKNKTQKGVITTASGLQYMVLKEGKGAKPKATDKVTVNYVGTLLDGKEFDSSYKRGEPASFQLNQVIKGWTEGLQLMSVGSKYKFFIPPGLGYGTQGAGALVGPNDLLIFEVELISIDK